jgi:hypothetical protein
MAKAMVQAIQTARELVNVFSFRAPMNSVTELEKFFSCADSVMAILLTKAQVLVKSSFSWAKPTATLLQPPLSFFSVTNSVMELGSVISFSLVSRLGSLFSFDAASVLAWRRFSSASDRTFPLPRNSPARQESNT